MPGWGGPYASGVAELVGIIIGLLVQASIWLAIAISFVFAVAFPIGILWVISLRLRTYSWKLGRARVFGMRSGDSYRSDE